MSWRSVTISKPARLSLGQNHLVIAQSEEIKIPLEDISAIVVETQQAVITSRLIDGLVERCIPMFVCDPKHLPSGLFLPFQQHSRFLKVLRSQLEQTLPFRKNCWRLIVKRKILNQAKCLELLRKDGAHELTAIASEVKSGDADNREGLAARVYFNNYMPTVTRQEDNTVNAALNYGYSIMRGAVARALCAFGFLPAVGLHHKSELNAFNLADDFMEVLRPLVDLWTAQNITEGEDFTVEDRCGLVGLLSADVITGCGRVTVSRAIDMMSASFGTATLDGEPDKLKLPELTELSIHGWN